MPAHECDYLVVAPGADYDIAATPGCQAGRYHRVLHGGRGEPPARRPARLLEGHAVVGVCGAPYKCPPAPSECVLMLHDLFTSRGVREQCEITLVLPLSSAVPPSPELAAP